MLLVNVLVGAVLLFFGRRLFWLFVAGIGFVVGSRLALDALDGQREWLIVLLALAVGVIGAFVSIFLQRLVVGIAGFLAGGYLLYMLALGLEYQSYAWIAFILGGVIGAILVSLLLDWALILLSALTGATVIVQSVALSESASVIVFLVLMLFGVAIQAAQLPRKPPARKRRDAE